ncbi:MAG: hypothetical protein ACOCUV_02880 [bacterium]
MIVDLIIKNGYLVDPVNKKEGYYDVAITNGKIVKVLSKKTDIKAKQTLDIMGFHICPGLIDLHVIK